MSTTYNYSISTNFGGNFNSSQFTELITNNSDITTTLSHINVYGDSVDIIFNNTLTSNELTALGSLVSTYVYGKDPYIDLVSSGTYGTIATLTIAQTTNRTLTLPDISDNLISNQNTATITNKTITNIHNNLAVGWSAVVSLSGKGDYTSISAAFNAGNGSVLVNAGTYYETNDIIIPNGGSLVGEANGLVTIVFIGNVGLKIDATNGINYTQGTISVTNNTNNVIGTGTNFTSLSVGQFISIGNSFYKIISITNDTNLTIETTYTGNTFSGATYIAQSMYTGVTIQNLLLIGSSTSPTLYVRGIRYCSLRYIAIVNGGPNLVMLDSGDSSMYTLIITNGTGDGIEIKNCFDILCDTINIFNNNGNGIKISGNSNSIIMRSVSSACNQQNGIYLTDTVDSIGISESVYKQNNISGLLSDINTTYITIQGCISIDNGSYGFNFNGNNYVLSQSIVKNNKNNGINCVGTYGTLKNNQCAYNSGNGINLANNNCILGSNIILNNTNSGIYCTGSNNIMNGNMIKQNTVNGIYIDNTANYNIVSNNQLISNGNNYNNNQVTTTTSSSNIMIT